jgi:hypothetical protein
MKTMQVSKRIDRLKNFSAVGMAQVTGRPSMPRGRQNRIKLARTWVPPCSGVEWRAMAIRALGPVGVLWSLGSEGQEGRNVA